MECREFEALFERWCAGTLDAEEKALCQAHLEACSDCAELAELAALPLPAEAGVQEASFVAGVLERTSGDVCSRLEQSLPALADSHRADGPAPENALLVEHVEHCGHCSGLIAEIEKLAVELPLLSDIQPRPSLVSAVLRATLPLSVRARRWWEATEARWVRRPRFAVELSYVATLALVVLFATPVSPLQAMPQKALEIVRAERVQGPERFDAWRVAAGRELDQGLEVVQGELTERARGVAAKTKRSVGTILDEVASWFENAGDEEGEPADENQKAQETS